MTVQKNTKGKRTMRIAILANDGSPLGVTMKTLYGEDGRVGCGGAEYALLTLCEAWHNVGHEVVLFNIVDPYQSRCDSPFEQRGVEEFDPEEGWDEVIIFRSPNHRSLSFHGHKTWFSTDQYTIGKFDEFAPTVNKIVTISPFHAQYFKREYGIHNTITIDLPVRIDDYAQEIEKVPGRLIFTSVPDRGLPILHAAWPLIKRDAPISTLVITSDYRLWGAGALNEQWRLKFAFDDRVQFLGAIPRRRLIDEEMKAEVLAYPGIYDELFCISVAEAQVAGAFPITSAFGALPTTNMGIVLEGKPTDPKWVQKFVDTVVEVLYREDKSERNNIVRKAMKRFNVKNILDQWDEKVFNG